MNEELTEGRNLKLFRLYCHADRKAGGSNLTLKFLWLLSSAIFPLRIESQVKLIEKRNPTTFLTI